MTPAQDRRLHLLPWFAIRLALPLAAMLAVGWRASV